jgi:hypothetical protein
MMIDLDLIDSLYEHRAGPIHYFGDADLSYVNTILKAVPGMIAELKAAREVVEAARGVIESLNPMFIETDEVIVRLNGSLKRLDEARRG